jgi:hypothetical protein
MSVLKYVIAAAVGLLRRTAERTTPAPTPAQAVTKPARGPQAAQLKQRGHTLAAERAGAPRDLIRRNRTTDATAGPDIASTTPDHPVIYRLLLLQWMPAAGTAPQSRTK